MEGCGVAAPCSRLLRRPKMSPPPQVRAPVRSGSLIGAQVSGWRRRSGEIGAVTGAPPVPSPRPIVAVSKSTATEARGVGGGTGPAPSPNPPAVREPPHIGPSIPTKPPSSRRRRPAADRYRVTSGPFSSAPLMVGAAVAVEVAEPSEAALAARGRANSLTLRA